MLRYRFTTPPYGKKKQWEAEFRANDKNATTGIVEIWGEHMRLLRQAMQYWKPEESPEWERFPQRVEAVLGIQKNGALRITHTMGIAEECPV